MGEKLFYSSVHEVMPDIIPAKKSVPDWYKEAPVTNPKDLQFTGMGGVKKSVKNCMPFFDALTVGYTVDLWQDIYVERRVDNSVYIRWNGEPGVFIEQPGHNHVPIPEGFEESHMSLLQPYTFKAPKGYSLFVTHPINRYDLPFLQTSGIVDLDDPIGQGYLPFFIKKGFKGLIPAGTPLVQIFPFKRESWTIERSDSLVQENSKREVEKLRVFTGWYKKLHNPNGLRTPLGDFQFIHGFYWDGVPTSDFYTLLDPLLEKIKPKHIIRAKINLSTPTPIPTEGGWHTDSPMPDPNVTTAVFYLNTNNGYTMFKDGTKVESLENRFASFSCDLEHTGVSSTDSNARVVLNLNYTLD